jgi:hypothetical protein
MDSRHVAISSVHAIAMGARAAPAPQHPAVGLTARDRAPLRAVEAGRCELVGGIAPELRVDGRWYCDQARAHDLVGAGLLAAPRASGRERGPAAHTTAGRHALAG